MATSEDIKSNSEFIRMSDELIEVPGGSNANNYANVQVVVNTAIRTNCDAVWAGWGHASENPELPRTVVQSGMLWLGPGPEAMETLGDKIRSTLIAQNCGVQVIPWSGDGIDGYGEAEFDAACVKTPDQAKKHAQRIGLPVMVKASEGGGGKGIRKVTDMKDIMSAYRQVCAEVPGSPIFIMKLGSEVRHVEVQLLADNYGNCIAIYGRDCSIQRRHQKIIEEGPVTACKAKTMNEMMNAAISLAQQVGYVGAGTVEYLLFRDGKYCFLELNPRLQVEHGVTELISGVNLPACQLLVAMGIPLFCIGDIRRMYGEDPKEVTPIDFSKAQLRETKRHIIACRITAENPAENFRPTTGIITELILRPRPQTFGYFSMKPGSSVHEFADSQIGHVFAVGSTRESARVNMLNTLRDLDIMGDISTNVEFLQFVLETPDFRKNRITTEWLEQVEWKKDTRTEIVVILGVAVAVHKAFQDERTKAISDVNRGRSLVGRKLRQLAVAEVSLIYQGVKYDFEAERHSELNYMLRLKNSDWCAPVEVRLLSDEGFLISLNCRTYVVYHLFRPSGLQIRVDGNEYLFENEYDPSVLTTEVPGKLVKLLVTSNTHIEKGQPYAEVEVMKMILQLKSPESGTIVFKVSEGSVLTPGGAIAILDLDEPEKIQKTEDFTGTLPEMGIPHEQTNKIQQLLTDSIDQLISMMDGYNFTSESEEIKERISNMVNCLRDPMMPAYEFMDALATVKDRIPRGMFRKLQVVCQDYCESANLALFPWEKPAVFPVIEVKHTIQAYIESLSDVDGIKSFETCITPIQEMLTKWTGGAGNYANNVFLRLLTNFYDVERYFSGLSAEESAQLLIQDSDGDGEKIVNILFAHSRLEYRVPIVLELLDIIEDIFQQKLFRYQHLLLPVLEKLMQLTDTPYAQVHIKCRSIKMDANAPTKYERWINLERLVRSNNQSASKEGKLRLNHGDVFGILPRFMSEIDKDLRDNAIHMFVEKIFNHHSVVDFNIDSVIGLTSFRLEPVASDAWGDVSPGCGLLGLFSDFNVCQNKMGKMISHFGNYGRSGEIKQLLLIVFMEPPKKLPSDEEVLAKMQDSFSTCIDELIKNEVTDVKLLLWHNDEVRQFYVFSKDLDFKENKLKRHIPPPVANTFELDRFEGVSIEDIHRDGDIYIYEAIAENSRNSDSYLFARYNVCPQDERVAFSSLLSLVDDIENLIYQLEVALFEVLISLEKILEQDREKYQDNHILMVYEYIQQQPIQFGGDNAYKLQKHSFTIGVVKAMEKVEKVYLERYHQALDQCHVHTIEIICRAKANISGRQAPPVRILLEAPYRRCFKIYPYLEYTKEGNRIFEPMRDIEGPMDRISIPQSRSAPPHEILRDETLSRNKVKRFKSVYAYDWPMLFQQSLSLLWKTKGKFEETFVTVKELVLNENESGLVETDRQPGENDIGMVAWLLTLKTPEYPNGREIVLVSNDMTHVVGTFGVSEDNLYYHASVLARTKGIPFVYMSCNSGARIALAKELMDVYKVSWVYGDEPQVPKGFEYFYLTPEDYEKYKDSVVCERREVEEGEVRYVIQAIIGKDHGLSVENLSGSGLIAAETSKAYDETVTMSYVSGRTVGIGAYLVRLGQRVIQKSGSPILLTGYQSLNNLLGKEVYLSNVQLGGLGIMAQNGVTHISVNDDVSAVAQIIKWLSYIPRTKHEVILPPLDMPELVDPIERDVSCVIEEEVYDIYSMIQGHIVEDEYISGIFDRGSFTETLSGWAKGVICGRARLGGIPIGVVASNTKLVTKIIPPDPANEDSTEQSLQRAGKVWHPDSAFKTANSIADMDREGLPLMIIANWRGFSGGARDMFHEVLKFGAYIVDALREYKQPVFVYIPPKAEVRGGAWVVIDTKINPCFIEMYASESGRGGVLEPNATAGLKYRTQQLGKLMLRLDPELNELKDEQKTNEIENQMNQRQALLKGLYRQVAIEFADLHDRPERMHKKKVVRDIVHFRDSRRYFYWRLRVRLEMQKIFKIVGQKNSMPKILHHFNELIIQELGPEAVNDDKQIAIWCAENQEMLLELGEKVKQEVIVDQLSSLLANYPGDASQAVNLALNMKQNQI